MVLALTLGGGPVAPNTMEKVVVSQATQNLNFLPLYIAKDRGYFEKRGLDVTIVTAGSGANAVSAVISGSSMFSLQDPMTAVLAALKGVAIKNVASVVSAPPTWIVVPKSSSIKTIEDLNGKTIATANPPSANTYLLEALLAKHKVAAKLTRVLLGTEFAPMLAGQADAAVMEEPSMEDALAQKYRILYKFSAMYARGQGGYCWTGVDAMEDSIAKRSVVGRFVDAIGDALVTIAKDPAAATEVAAREFPSFSPDKLRVAIGRYKQEGLFPMSPLLTQTQFANAVDMQVKAGNLKPAEAKYAATVDASFAQHPSRR